MTFDLLVRNATLPDGRAGLDIAVAGGRIVAVERGIAGEAARSIDAGGHLVSPPFVDVHFHMDATLSLGLPRLNESGTLLEGIALWGELKPLLTPEAVIERALRYCDLAVAQGLLAIRSHVDVCDDRLLAVDALLEVKRQVAPYLDLQLVAFPQDGYYRSPGAVENLRRALDRGVDVVGGIPHFERTMADGAASVRALCEIAAERGLRVDMHCDETDDPLSRHIETLAAETSRLGLQGRVAGSHLTSMHSMDNYYVSKLLPLIAEADVAAIANPLINIVIQGRHDTYPKRRGMTRIPELRDRRHPVRVRARLRDGSLVLARVRRHARSRPHGGPCRPHDEPGGDAVLLRGGHDAIRPGSWGSRATASSRAATAISCSCRRGIRSRRSASRRRASPSSGAGRVIAETPPSIASLALSGRPGAVDPAAYAPGR